MALNGGSSPYVEKNFDLDFSTTRTPYYLGPAYPNQPTPNWFSSAVFGSSGADDVPAWFASAIDPQRGDGLPPWFFGGALLIGGAVVWFALKKKGK